MLRFEMNITNRKDLVKRLGELTGEKPKYTGVPKCAYKTSQFTITKDGTLEAEDSADQNVIDTLIAEGLVKGNEASADDMPSEEATEVDVQTAEAFTVSLPIGEHNVSTLTNLINLIYTRAGLLNKSLGTSFAVEEDLVEALKELPGTAKVTDVMYTVGEDELAGLEITQEKLIFGPLSEPTPEKVKAFMDLVTMMNKQALTQKRIQAKAVNDESEKYALRIWLIRLGMNGPEYKDTRKVLMQNLSGAAAFRNDDEKAKWTAKQTEKRAAARAEAAS